MKEGEVKQPSYYAIIPANVRYDKNLNPNAKLLYGEITSLTNEKGFCWASNSYFAELYSTSERTVQRWVKSLEDGGYITLKISRLQTGTTRKIYLNTGGDKNVQGGVTKMSRPHDKNVTHNNTYNNKEESAAPIPKEDIEPVPYIISVLDLTPQVTLERWCMNYRIDPIDLRDEMENFANWYFSNLCERSGEDEATEKISNMKLRAMISTFETKFLRNYKAAV